MPAHSLLFSKSTKGAVRLNVPIRRTNRYQQYYMPSEHTCCGKSLEFNPGLKYINNSLSVYIQPFPIILRRFSLFNRKCSLYINVKCISSYISFLRGGGHKKFLIFFYLAALYSLLSFEHADIYFIRFFFAL